MYLNGQPLAMIVANTPENVYYYHNDHLGTPQVMTDSVGAVVWEAAYDPFGEATINIGQITNNLRFPGQYFDAETGLCYNWNRDYNPQLGRYIESDPIGLKGGINLYIYSQNNPIRLIDTDGRKVQICYSPMDSFFTDLKHASIQTSSCGTWGFYPKVKSSDAFTWTPGVVKDDSNKEGLDCSKETAMTKCVDEQCVCNKIKAARKNPGAYGAITYNCHSWVRQIISECQRP